MKRRYYSHSHQFFKIKASITFPSCCWMRIYSFIIISGGTSPDKAWERTTTSTAGLTCWWPWGKNQQLGPCGPPLPPSLWGRPGTHSVHKVPLNHTHLSCDNAYIYIWRWCKTLTKVMYWLLGLLFSLAKGKELLSINPYRLEPESFARHKKVAVHLIYWLK